MKAIDIRLVHRGDYLCTYEIDYISELGNKRTYEMVSKCGSKVLKLPELTLETLGSHLTAIVLCVFNETVDKMLLTNEFRMGVNRNVVGNVAGLIDKNEIALDACRRELKEETNLDLLTVLDVLQPTFTSAPVTDDITQLVICTASGVLDKSNSDFEEVNAKWYSKEEVEVLLRDNNVIFAGRCQALCYAWVKGGLFG